MQALYNQLQLVKPVYPVETIEYQNKEKNKRSALFTAYQGRQEAGTCCCSLGFDTAQKKVVYLEDIYVLPEYRKKGIARSLVKACELWAREKAAKKIIGKCSFLERDNYKFYLLVGFVQYKDFFTFVKELTVPI